MGTSKKVDERDEKDKVDKVDKEDKEGEKEEANAQEFEGIRKETRR